MTYDKTNAEQKVLHLTLKKKWFDMIASGEKKEEYREVKPYWISRLVDDICPDTEGRPFTFMLNGYCYSMWSAKYYDAVVFRNGYRKDSPTIKFEVKNIEIEVGKEKWGAEWAKEYFVISLGKQLIP